MKSINELKHISRVLFALNSVTAQQIVNILANQSEPRPLSWLAKMICRPSASIRPAMRRLFMCGIVFKKKREGQETNYGLSELHRGQVFAIYDNARVVNRVQTHIHSRARGETQ